MSETKKPVVPCCGCGNDTFEVVKPGDPRLVLSKFTPTDDEKAPPNAVDVNMRLFCDWNCFDRWYAKEKGALLTATPAHNPPPAA